MSVGTDESEQKGKIDYKQGMKETTLLLRFGQYDIKKQQQQKHQTTDQNDDEKSAPFLKYNK